MTEDRTAFTQTARVTTPNASRYLQRLCKHFAHKVHCEWDEHQGHIRFSIGKCEIRATPSAFYCHCSANSAYDLADLVDTVVSHFERFSKQEGLQMLVEDAA